MPSTVRFLPSLKRPNGQVSFVWRLAKIEKGLSFSKKKSFLVFCCTRTYCQLKVNSAVIPMRNMYLKYTYSCSMHPFPSKIVCCHDVTFSRLAMLLEMPFLFVDLCHGSQAFGGLYQIDLPDVTFKPQVVVYDSACYECTTTDTSASCGLKTVSIIQPNSLVYPKGATTCNFEMNFPKRNVIVEFRRVLPPT